MYHAYYFQVQVQLKFSDAQYCDFVVWNVDHLFVQRLCLDEPFITVALEKCKQFIKLAILPEILGKWYSWEPLSLSDNETKSLIETNQDESQDLWCYCRKGESGTMIACENQECPIEWFHTECLHIKTIPKGKWFCPDCRKKMKKSHKS